MILEHYNRTQAAPQSLIVENIIEQQILSTPQSQQIQEKILGLFEGNLYFILKINFEKEENNSQSSISDFEDTTIIAEGKLLCILLSI